MNNIKSSTPPGRADGLPSKTLWLLLLFFISGCPALIYQIVWQRSLFTLFGTNTESVSVIVAAFMLGLGLGSLAGGGLTRIYRRSLLELFALIELCIGFYGLFSLDLFRWVQSQAWISTYAELFLVGTCLVLLPTFLMGATLPILVAFLFRKTQNVGQTVGLLYCVNTLGSAFICFLAAIFLMGSLGQSRIVFLAASLNIFVAISALIWLLYLRTQKQETLFQSQKSSQHESNILTKTVTPSFKQGTILAFGLGFLALAYEILWIRLINLTTGSRAPAFALVLSFYLLGTAIGSLLGTWLCHRSELTGKSIKQTLLALVIAANLVAFFVAPLFSFQMYHSDYINFLWLISLSSAFFGISFPLLCHVFIHHFSHVGWQTSLIYVANIAGSTMGSLLVGLVLLEHWSFSATSYFLYLMGTGLCFILIFSCLKEKRKRVYTLSLLLVLCVGSNFIKETSFNYFYERLLYKKRFDQNTLFARTVENKSGVINVTKGKMLLGNGAYDGKYSTSLVPDQNMLIRAFLGLMLHPNPKRVFVLGLGSGSWASVIAKYPSVKSMTSVEINPGYVELMKEYPEVKHLAKDQRLDLIVDDARRWLNQHPNEKFDLIVANPTLHWRASSSNLLSMEFMDIVKEHLNEGGVFVYNFTGSGRVIKTGALSFSYAFRLLNALAVSDKPFFKDLDHWRSILESYPRSGQSNDDENKIIYQSQIERILLMMQPLEVLLGQTNSAEEPQGEWLTKSMAGLGYPLQVGPDFPAKWFSESRKSILEKTRSLTPITDDNMGTEWDFY